jgi:predicted ATP-grasp superfamily ATP-dependent carboligase
MKDHCCVVIGGYINGYSIIQELYSHSVREIILVDFVKDISYYSNKVCSKYVIENNCDSLLGILNKLKYDYAKLILYPTQDVHLNYLHNIYNEILDYSYVAFNPETVIQYQDKFKQYEICEKLGIPYPKTIFCGRVCDLDLVENLLFPIIIKPVKKDNLSTNIFRNIILRNKSDLELSRKKIETLITCGNSFIISEVIPGDGSNIYAYTSFVTDNGKVLGEWTGKKLSQFPNDFGVFASAKGVKNDIITNYGRRLIKEINLWGVNEPEFKYDIRDDSYKLMEINLRPMMWHLVGHINGVSLNYYQFLYATQNSISYSTCQEYSEKHFVNIYYELINLIIRKKYLKIFISNVFNRNNVIAGFDKSDYKPFFYMVIVILRKYIHKSKRDNL